MTDAPAPEGGSGGAPLLHVVSGRPDHAELAAVVAVLVSRAVGGTAGPAPDRRGPWGHPAVMLKGRAPAGGWRPLPGPRP